MNTVAKAGVFFLLFSLILTFFPQCNGMPAFLMDLAPILASAFAILTPFLPDYFAMTMSTVIVCELAFYAVKFLMKFFRNTTVA